MTEVTPLPNHLSTSEPYETYMGYIVIDLDTNQPIPYCQEVNVEEGWIMEGTLGEACTRRDGHFEIIRASE